MLIFVQEFLRNPDRYIRLGARPPRGVLLVSWAYCSGDEMHLSILSTPEFHLGSKKIFYLKGPSSSNWELVC